VHIGPGEAIYRFALLELVADDNLVRLPGQAMNLTAEPAESLPGERKPIAVIGYNFWDARHRPEIVATVFGFEPGKKRCSPGLVRELQETQIAHDCSTLAGSAGSPILALETGRVVGVHTGGTAGGSNFGTLISAIYEGDPKLQELLAADWTHAE
jgi:hypothetical protein